MMILIEKFLKKYPDFCFRYYKQPVKFAHDKNNLKYYSCWDLLQYALNSLFMLLLKI